MDNSADSRAGALVYLRAPRFNATDRKTPRQAVIHALPATLFMVANIWVFGLGLVLFLGLFLALPMAAIAVGFLVIAVPCGMASWGIFVRCVEVEASIDD